MSDSSLKARSALLMIRNSLTPLRGVQHKPEHSNVMKTVSGMFIQFYIVCLNSTSTVFCRSVLPCQILLPTIKTVGSTIRHEKL